MRLVIITNNTPTNRYIHTTIDGKLNTEEW